MRFPFSLPPIVERELRVGSRQSATYWSRTGAASSGIIIVCWVLAAQLAAGPAARAGQFTFRVLAGIAAFTAVASVLQLASAAFAREKREDTLGLLFLTPLKPIDLVVGKLVFTSLGAFYRFLSIVPLLALPMLVGGVTAENFLLLVLGLIHFVFLGATLGLYISSRSWDDKRAATAASVTMFCLVLLPAVALVLSGGLGQPRVASLFAISPAYPIWQATVPGAAHSGLFWASLLWTQILGWIFFRAACRTLPRCWQDRPLNLAPVGEHLQSRDRKELAQTPVLADELPLAAAQVRRSVRGQFSGQQRGWMLDQNPVFWLAMRSRPRSSAAWILGALGLVACGVMVATGHSDKLLSPGLALFMCFCVNAAFKTQISTQASRAFARDGGKDPLELLLSTPITARELMDGHMRALRDTLRPWIQGALWIETGWLAATITFSALSGAGGTWLYVLASIAIVGFLVPDLYAVAWTALWRGVIARNAREAEQEANSQVLVLPWLPTVLSSVAVSIAGPTVGFLAALLSWTLFSAGANRWFGRRARYNLETRLHLWALRRSAGEFEHYDGWRRFGRWLGRWWRVQFYGR
jgi:hypothetical protein